MIALKEHGGYLSGKGEGGGTVRPSRYYNGREVLNFNNKGESFIHLKEGTYGNHIEKYSNSGVLLWKKTIDMELNKYYLAGADDTRVLRYLSSDRTKFEIVTYEGVLLESFTIPHNYSTPTIRSNSVLDFIVLQDSREFRTYLKQGTLALREDFNHFSSKLVTGEDTGFIYGMASSGSISNIKYFNLNKDKPSSSYTSEIEYVGRYSLIGVRTYT